MLCGFPGMARKLHHFLRSMGTEPASMSSSRSLCTSLLGVWGSVLFLTLAPVPAFAVVPNVLDGCTGVTPDCTNGVVNHPTTANPPSPFGFTASQGPQTGDLLIDVLIPNNEDSNPSA